MYHIVYFRFFVILLSGVVYVAPANGQNFLEGDVLVKAFSGKTITFQSRSGSGMNIVFFGNDSSLVFGNSVRKESRLTGKWRVKMKSWFPGPKELLCRKYNSRPEQCMKVSFVGNTAKFVEPGNRPLYEVKILVGNHLP